MSEHTKEPWSYRKTNYEGHASGAFYIYGETTDHRSPTVAHIKQSTIQPMEANARRIVACVNACAGIDIEYLESPDNLATYARKMTIQRDELLAELKSAIEHIDFKCEVYASAYELITKIEANHEP